MSWIKPTLLWMMYRSSWGTKAGQKVTLAIWLQREAFDESLQRAVPSTIQVVRQRCTCQECGQPFVHPLPDMDERHLMTKRMIDWIWQKGFRPDIPDAYTECLNGMTKEANRAGSGFSYRVIRGKMIRASIDRPSGNTALKFGFVTCGQAPRSMGDAATG